MPVNLDPQFSVYKLVERVQNQQATTSMLYHRATMNMISYEIENATRIDGAKNRIFSSFQYMSRFLPQVQRYTAIANRAEIVYVFGVMDVKTLPQIPNLHYVALQPGDQLAREWFVVSYSPTFATVLATEEQGSITDPDTLRRFKGLWSFDLELTRIMDEWLRNTVDAQVLQPYDKHHDTRTQAILVNKMLQRMTDTVMKRRQTTTFSESQDQLRVVVESTLRPAAQSGR